MRLKLSVLPKPRHQDTVTAVGWSSTDQVVSVSDDHTVLRWNLVSEQQETVCDLGADVFPVDLHLVPRDPDSVGGKRSAGSAAATDMFVLATADGRFLLMNRSGRVEKAVDAHKGAVLTCRWSADGSALLTSGEDGALKMWSRSGMLRSTVVQADSAIYTADWGPGGNSVVYAHRKQLVVKPLQPNSKVNSWKAHDGIILALDWNANNQCIVSGAEDCRYRVWDAVGRMVYSGAVDRYPITSVRWSGDGGCLAVGCYNTLRLCDARGWSHALEKPSGVGSLLAIAWSSDGTQLAAATASGHVLFAHVVDKRMEWQHYEATVTGRNSIQLRDCLADTWEQLEFQDRIIMTSFAYGYLIVVTTGQCSVYSSKNWNTPLIFQLKEGNVHLILQASRLFALFDGGSILVYTYDARLQCSPRWTGMRLAGVSALTASLSNDTLAVRDPDALTVVQLLDLVGAGKPVADRPYTHTCAVLQLTLDQCLAAVHRKLALVDASSDIYTLHARRPSAARKPLRLAVMTSSVCWSTEANMLAGMQESRLCVWLFPGVLHVDKELLSSTVLITESPEFRSPSVVGFSGSQVRLRRSDGSLLVTAVTPYAAALHRHAASAQWRAAVRLCRLVKMDALWSCLAGLACEARELSTAEIAYSAIDMADKVEYLRYIRDLPSPEVRQSEMALLSGGVQEAESVLLRANQLFRAIMLNVQLYNWNKALDLAVRYKAHVDTVLTLRDKYLERFGRHENSKPFLEYKTMVKEAKKKQHQMSSSADEEIQDVSDM